MEKIPEALVTIIEELLAGNTARLPDVKNYPEDAVRNVVAALRTGNLDVEGTANVTTSGDIRAGRESIVGSHNTVSRDNIKIVINLLEEQLHDGSERIVENIVDPPDRAGHPCFFFLSYASDDFDHCLKRFYHDLADEIHKRSGQHAKSEIGFCGKAPANSPEQWPEAITTALNTARVFIYIHSPNYFTKEQCGQEWTLFQTRLDYYRKQNPKDKRMPPPILPVLWIPYDAMPPCAADLQFPHERFGEKYAQEGLRYLMKLQRHADEYQLFLTQFAKHALRIANQYALPGLERIPAGDQIENAFQSQPAPAVQGALDAEHVGPKYTQFIYVAGRMDELRAIKQEIGAYGDEGGVDWKPYFPDQTDEVGIIMQTVVSMEKFRYQVLPLTDDLIGHLREAQQCNKIVIIIVDPWSLQLRQYAEAMQKYDTSHFFNSVVLVLLNTEDKETRKQFPHLTGVLQQTFLNSTLDAHADSFRDAIGSMDELQRELIQALHKIRDKIVKASRIVRKIPGDGMMTAPIIHADERR